MTNMSCQLCSQINKHSTPSTSSYPSWWRNSVTNSICIPIIANTEEIFWSLPLVTRTKLCREKWRENESRTTQVTLFSVQDLRFPQQWLRKPLSFAIQTP
jgi:hypothetical protein